MARGPMRAQVDLLNTLFFQLRNIAITSTVILVSLNVNLLTLE